MKPISPQEAKAAQQSAIPDEVFEAFNELITKNLNGRYVTISQCEVVDLIKKKLSLKTDNPIVENRWLNIETHYEKCGWNVEYDRPGWNESGEAVFKFEAKK